MFLKRIPVNATLIVLLSVYYVLFINKGIVIYDEGYYAHLAERILNGGVPYRDFFLQFTPGYFYILALFYKVFGVSVITGRILTLLFCLGIGWVTLMILNRFKIELRLKILSLTAIASFGFPLINNMSLLAWPSVFLSLIAILFFIDKKYILLGTVLSLILFTKQNLGVYFFILTNIFLVLNSKKKLSNIFYVNVSFFLITVMWFSYFFLFLNRLDKFFELFKFSSRYLFIYPFSYPPLTFLMQPTGILKLLPYYTPVIFVLILIKRMLSKKKNVSVLYFSMISIAGFFGTVYPTSDLLHVYPFFGLFIVSLVLFYKEEHLPQMWKYGILFIIVILIGTGLYLTQFREYYRYQPRYLFQNSKTEIPRMKNIYIDEPLATDLSYLNLFFLINTRKTDSILCYPFCPMIYFLMEKKNPTRYANYYPGYLTDKEETNVIQNMRERKTKYIVTFLNYKFKTPISKFIQMQKIVFQTGQFKIFQVN